MAQRVLITTDRVGRGSDELGRVLMKSFLYSLARNAEKPSAVLLMNDGVRLACEGSDSVSDLQLLAEDGVSIRACGTCLDFLSLRDSLVVGEIGTMPDSVAGLLADDVLTIA